MFDTGDTGHLYMYIDAGSHAGSSTVMIAIAIILTAKLS